MESFAVQPYARQIATASHHGVVKLYRYEDGALTGIWASEDTLGSIPRGLIWAERGSAIIAYGLEKGIM